MEMVHLAARTCGQLNLLNKLFSLFTRGRQITQIDRCNGDKNFVVVCVCAHLIFYGRPME